MAKFRVLRFNQDFMARIGINSHRLHEPVNEFFHSFFTYFFLFHIIVFCITSSAFFVCQNLSDLGVAFATCSIVVAGFQCGGMYLSVGLKMTTVKTLHLKLQGIVDEGDEISANFLFHLNQIKNIFFQTAHDVEIVDLYRKNEQKCYKYSRRASLYIIFNQISFISSFVYSIFMLLTSTFDASKLLLPFNFVVPFNTQTLWGWYLMWFLQFNTGISYIFSTVSVISYFMCCCYYIGAICDHFDILIEMIKNDLEFYRKENNPLVYRKLGKSIQRKFHQSIAIHIKAFE